MWCARNSVPSAALRARRHTRAGASREGSPVGSPRGLSSKGGLKRQCPVPQKDALYTGKARSSWVMVVEVATPFEE